MSLMTCRIPTPEAGKPALIQFTFESFSNIMRSFKYELIIHAYIIVLLLVNDKYLDCKYPLCF